ncbi:10 kDa chaperonin 1 protein [Thalictrum thalictroides]|uniref:10 kDa chaperonin 1 protein n=1 Tax=Thalictrum thalictroides TaxID=46969 RepID=A0A7J6WTR9_THATH|nr:10 kDa chaperonin 1 protein [Thalictrum thalictroides]
MAMASASCSFITIAKPNLSSHKLNFPSSSSQRLPGLRNKSLKVNAVGLKWEPTKVVPQADRVLIRLEELPQSIVNANTNPPNFYKVHEMCLNTILRHITKLV